MYKLFARRKSKIWKRQKRKKAFQRYKCKFCGKIWVFNQNSNRISEQQAKLIFNLLEEGLSLRGIAGSLEISLTTVRRFMAKKP